VDGLAQHHKLYQANIIFEAFKIRIIVEIPHSSHLNQVRSFPLLACLACFLHYSFPINIEL
jgi:hypothetical protein